MSERVYEVTILAFELSDEEAEALFDRVAEAAHAEDQPVIVSGRWTPLEDE